MEYVIGLRINKLLNTLDRKYNKGGYVDEYEFITRNAKTSKLTSRKYILELGESETQSMIESANEIKSNTCFFHYTPIGQLIWKSRTMYGGNGYYELCEDTDELYPTAKIDVNLSSWKKITCESKVVKSR